MRLNSCVSRSVSGRSGSSTESIDDCARPDFLRRHWHGRQRKDIAVGENGVHGRPHHGPIALRLHVFVTRNPAPHLQSSADAVRERFRRFLERLGVIRERFGKSDVHIRGRNVRHRSRMHIGDAGAGRLSADRAPLRNSGARRRPASAENSRRVCRCAGVRIDSGEAGGGGPPTSAA